MDINETIHLNDSDLESVLDLESDLDDLELILDLDELDYDFDSINVSDSDSDSDSDTNSETNSETGSDDLTSDEIEDIYEEMYEYIYEYVNKNIVAYSKPNFQKDAIHVCSSYFLEMGSIQGWCELEDDDAEIVNKKMIVSVTEFLYHTIVTDILNLPKRQELSPPKRQELSPPKRQELSPPKRQESLIQKNKTNSHTTNQILNKVNDYPIQKQRSTEWYEIRKTLFSASNIWKLFGTPSQYNSLIYEKCKPIEMSSYGGVTNMNSPLNWGIKYEPVSVMVYEDMYKTTVNTNYGCIPHHTLPIGASPDGIVNDPNSSQYGHMVEIKNIYNREITGIPSEDYWIQMQVQLETTGLTYCDFLETRFKEYENVESYKSDESHKYTGIILYFIPLDNVFGVESKFVYKPIHVKEGDTVWIEAQSLLHEQTHVLYETMYWYLDEVSCVLVERNPVWFLGTVPIIKNAWETVTKEKQEGYEHRAPQKRKPKANNDTSLLNNDDLQTSHKQIHCLIKLDENGSVVNT